MNKKIPFIFYSVLTVCVGLHSPVYAQGTNNPPPPENGEGMGKGEGNGPGHRPIPKEAIDACNGKTAGETCSFTGRMDNTIEGTCRTPPRAEGQVVCVPKPPQQAFDACKGKAEGDTCTFTGRRGMNVNGTCKKPPVGGEDMVCRPDKRPMSGNAGNNPPATQ